MENIWRQRYPGLEIALIPHGSNVFYILLREGEAAVVDPPTARPVIDLLREEGARLSCVLITHHDPDHVGGVDELAGPDVQRVEPTGRDRLLSWQGLEIHELYTPGHRRVHSAYFMPRPAPGALFSGDCLFSGGCGRLNGLPPELMFASLQKLAALPDKTHVYCGHDYLESNLAFARMVEPENEAILRRLDAAREAARAGLATLPSTIAWEKATNPFLRARSVEDFADRRAKKDRW